MQCSTRALAASDYDSVQAVHSEGRHAIKHGKPKHRSQANKLVMPKHRRSGLEHSFHTGARAARTFVWPISLSMSMYCVNMIIFITCLTFHHMSYFSSRVLLFITSAEVTPFTSFWNVSTLSRIPGQKAHTALDWSADADVAATQQRLCSFVPSTIACRWRAMPVPA